MFEVDPIQHEVHSDAARQPRPCGHARHVGTCPVCQQAQLARWRAQLLAVQTELHPQPVR
jgi:hypothetical protein